MKLQFNILLLLSFLIFNSSCQSIKKWVSKNPNTSSKRAIASFSSAEWCSINYGELYNKDRRAGMVKALKDNASSCIEHLISKDAGSMEVLIDICSDKYTNTKAGFLKTLIENSFCVEYFLEKHKGYVNASLKNNGTRALMMVSHNPKMTQRLLDEGAKPNLRDTKGRTALHWAVLAKNLEVVKALLRAKADPNLQDNEGNSALILSVLNYHHVIHPNTLPIVKVLLKAGAKPNLKNRKGHNVILALARSLRSGPKDLFKQYVPSSAQLMKAKGAFVAVMDELYLSSRADFNAQDNEGKTILIHLSQKKGDHLGRFKLLFSRYRKINPNAQDKFGRSALMYTAKNNFIKASQFLLEQGADPNIRDNEGKRALEHVSYGHKGAAQLHQILSQITEPNPYAKPEHKRIKTRKPQEGRPFGTL